MSLRGRSNGGQLPWWFGIPFAFGGVVVLVLGFVLLRDELRFGSEGVSVVAVVTDAIYHPGGGEDGPTFELRYAFVDPATGRSHDGQSDVGEDTFDATEIGEQIEVTYLPDDPNKSRVGSPDPQLLVPAAVLGGGALFSLVGVGLLVLTWRIRRHGAPAWLTITSAAVEAENDGDDVSASNPFAVFMADDAPSARPAQAPQQAPRKTDEKLTEDQLRALDARLAPEGDPPPGGGSTGSATSG
jgi:hypothetical protein